MSRKWSMHQQPPVEDIIDTDSTTSEEKCNSSLSNADKNSPVLSNEEELLPQLHFDSELLPGDVSNSGFDNIETRQQAIAASEELLSELSFNDRDMDEMNSMIFDELLSENFPNDLNEQSTSNEDCPSVNVANPPSNSNEGCPKTNNQNPPSLTNMDCFMEENSRWRSTSHRSSFFVEDTNRPPTLNRHCSTVDHRNQTSSTNKESLALFNSNRPSTSNKGSRLVKKNETRVKRPMNAFMIWSSNERKLFSAKNPKMHNSEISKELGSQWNKMPLQQKEKYKVLAKHTREEHLKNNPGYKYKPRRKPKQVSSNSKYAETNGNRHQRLRSPQTALQPRSGCQIMPPVFSANVPRQNYQRNDSTGESSKGWYPLFQFPFSQQTGNDNHFNPSCNFSLQGFSNPRNYDRPAPYHIPAKFARRPINSNSQLTSYNEEYMQAMMSSLAFLNFNIPCKNNQQMGKSSSSSLSRTDPGGNISAMQPNTDIYPRDNTICNDLVVCNNYSSMQSPDAISCGLQPSNTQHANPGFHGYCNKPSPSGSSSDSMDSLQHNSALRSNTKSNAYLSCSQTKTILNANADFSDYSNVGSVRRVSSNMIQSDSRDILHQQQLYKIPSSSIGDFCMSEQKAAYINTQIKFSFDKISPNQLFSELTTNRPQMPMYNSSAKAAPQNQAPFQIQNIDSTFRGSSSIYVANDPSTQLASVNPVDHHQQQHYMHEVFSEPVPARRISSGNNIIRYNSPMNVCNNIPRNQINSRTPPNQQQIHGVVSPAMASQQNSFRQSFHYSSQMNPCNNMSRDQSSSTSPLNQQQMHGAISPAMGGSQHSLYPSVNSANIRYASGNSNDQQ